MKGLKRLLLLVLAMGTTLVALPGGASAQVLGPRARPQTFTITFNGNNTQGRVIASGPISGVGVTDSIDDFHDEIMLPGGSVFITHHDVPTSDRFNAATCTDTFSFKGALTITGGTGIYANARGAATYRGNGIFVGVRNPDGSCSDTDGTAHVTITAHGTAIV